MSNKPRWALEWAWVGAATSALAPLPASMMTPFVSNEFMMLAGGLGAVSGLLVGTALSALHEALPERSRVAVLGVVMPIPLGIWGAMVAAVAAFYTEPKMAGLAFFLGSISAIMQMMWFVPTYTAAVRRGWQLVPLLLAMLGAPGCGFLGVLGFFTLGEVLRTW